jgi:NAD(P)-dependent dehydrogenase (short-subunit alcohol dehydrogenase family)
MSSLRIVLTGVSRGLGRAMLDGFAARGHTVYGCATSANVIEQLRAEYPGPHHFDVVDVSEDDQVETWASAVLGHGPPNLLVNNAALINTSGVLWEVHPKEFEKLLNVNVTGTFNMIRQFVPEMISAGTGVIVNFSSGWGRSTSPEVVPYCASKWAIEGLSRGLAQELPRGLASVALNPGIIHTDMLNSCFGASASSFPSPKEWAERAVPYLLGLDATDNGRSVDVPT